MNSYINRGLRRPGKLSTKFSIKELKEEQDLKIKYLGAKEDELVSFVKFYLKNSTKSISSRFNNQLFSGHNKAALVGDLLAAVTNTTMATFEASPVGTLLEEELVDSINRIIGFTNKGNKGEGIMTTGGSQANMLALICARNNSIKECKNKGVYGESLVGFVSEDCHYSFAKMFNIIGIGSENLLKVKTDSNGQMDTLDLEKKIQTSVTHGKKPFFIGATAGTTVYGAFDPIDKVSKIAEKYNIYLHVDGAWGGPVIFSQKHFDLIKGIEKVDSFSMDAHKLLGVPLTATFFLVKKSGTLLSNFSEDNSEYLFHQDSNENINLGPKSIQCGRRVDALKVWFSWKAKGYSGLEQIVDKNINTMQCIVNYIKSVPELEIIKNPMYLNVCFRIKSNSNIPTQNSDLLKVRGRLIENNDFYINYSKDKNGLLFFRLIVLNLNTKLKEYYLLIDKILKYSRELVNTKNDTIIAT